MKRAFLIIFILSLLIAGVFSWFASESPDGLERVAENLGFIGNAKEPFMLVLPDYTIPGFDGFLSKGIAGIIGVFSTFLFVFTAGKIIKRLKR